MTELPLTVTRRRTANVSSGQTHTANASEVTSSHGFGTVAFSSINNLSSFFWTNFDQNSFSSSSSSSLITDRSTSCNKDTCIQPFVPLESLEKMPSRDRTSEFRTSSKSIQMKMRGMPVMQRESNGNHIVQESAQFAQLAKRIGRDLSSTCAKMEKLTELAKRRSLFDDRMAEVEELSQVIRQDITGLNRQIAVLQEYFKINGNLDVRKQGRGHSQLVVVGLQSKLAGVSRDFQNVLELRTENLKQQKSRREKFGHSQPVLSSLPPSVSTNSMGSILLQDDFKASSSSVLVDMDHIEQHRVQQQISLINEQDSYLQARSSTMETIESSISELGQIFRQLASLVSEQGELVTRIDSNVEETSLNVEAAHTELVKYFHSISQNRWLMIKVFGVLLFFFIIFIIFLT